MTRRPIRTDRDSGLPAREEFSIQGILDAIHEDIEGDLNTVAEILGRSRFVLADQHEAQMPPQGEIVLNQGERVETAAANEGRLADENVLILNEDASLVDGSNSGSAAYGLLERLQVVPRPARMNSDAPALTSMTPEVISPVRTHSSPAAIQPEPDTSFSMRVPSGIEPRQRIAIMPDRSPASAVVSETYLAAEANGVNSGIVPIVSEAGRHYPLYAHEDIDVFESSLFPARPLVASRRLGSWAVPDMSTLTSWFSTARRTEDQDAEARLRGLLHR